MSVATANGEADTMPDRRKLARRRAPVHGDIEGFTRDQVELVKRTIAQGATDDELKMFLYHARRTGLDPFARQIYFIRRWDTQQQKNIGAIQTGIDGMRLIASRTGRYRPDDETPRYIYDANGVLEAATVRVYVFHSETKTWYPVPAEARFEEYSQRTRDNKLFPNWQRMGHLMLAKCAEALALRKAFPADLSGIYSEEEVAVIGEPEPRELPRSEAQSEIPAPPPHPEHAQPHPTEPAASATSGAGSTKDQQLAIHRLAKGKHKLTDEQLDAWLKTAAGVESTTALTFQQASELIGMLQGTPTEGILRRLAPQATPEQTSLVR